MGTRAVYTFKDADELRQIVSYDPATGVFVWVKGGAVAGRKSTGGYIQISISGRKYWAHRLAWFYVHGEWPSGLVDHVNMDTGDNRIDNLRLASKSENARNSSKHKDNTTGFKGVARFRDKFQAGIGVDGKRIYLGVFDTAEQAHAAYCQAAKKYHGDYRRT